MSNVKVGEIEGLGYFSTQTSTYVSSLHSSLSFMTQQLRTNLEDAKEALGRIRKEFNELRAAADEDDWYLVEAKRAVRDEAKAAYSELKSVFGQLLETIHSTRTNVTSLAEDASDFVTRYRTYLQNRK